jgi:hypothetical protein
MNIPLMDKRVRSLEETVAELKATVSAMSQEMLQYKEETLRSKSSDTTRTALNYALRKAHQESEEAERLQERRDYIEWKVKLALKCGSVVEDLVAPVICDVLRRWFDVPSFYKCSTSLDCCCSKPVAGSKVHRFELIADCGAYTVVSETRYSLDYSDVPLIMDSVRNYRECLPGGCDLNLIGCLAALKAEVSFIKYASAHGILVLAVGEDLMDVMNEPGFKPRIF